MCGRHPPPMYRARLSALLTRGDALRVREDAHGAVEEGRPGRDRRPDSAVGGRRRRRSGRQDLGRSPAGSGCARANSRARRHDRPLKGIEVKVQASDLSAERPLDHVGCRPHRRGRGLSAPPSRTTARRRYFRVQARLVAADLTVEDGSLVDLGHLDFADRNWRTIWKIRRAAGRAGRGHRHESGGIGAAGGTGRRILPPAGPHLVPPALAPSTNSRRTMTGSPSPTR